MTNLPITTSLAAVPASNKPASGEDTAATGEQAFGAVLARQFAGAAGANTAKLGQVLDKLGATQAATDKDTPDLSTAAGNLPADMLATLLAQHGVIKDPSAQTDAKPAGTQGDVQAALAQQQAAIAVTGVAQPIPGNTALPHAAEHAGDKNPLVTSALPGNGAQTAAPVRMDATPAAAPAAQDKAAFGEALQALDNKAAALATGAASRSHDLADLSAANQSLAMAPLSAHQPAPAAPAAGAALSVNTPVGQSGWSDEFSQKITWIANQRDQSAELHLNPPQLGPLDVVLKVSGDQATALFTSPHAAVREAIEQALPKLREMLADSGIMLGNATVNDQTTRKEQDNFAHPQYDNAGTTGLAVGDHQAESTTTTISRHNGLVDTFA